MPAILQMRRHSFGVTGLTESRDWRTSAMSLKRRVLP